MPCCLILTNAVLSSVCVYGGGSRKGQIQVVQKGVEIVIGDEIVNKYYNALYHICLTHKVFFISTPLSFSLAA